MSDAPNAQPWTELYIHERIHHASWVRLCVMTDVSMDEDDTLVQNPLLHALVDGYELTEIDRGKYGRWKYWEGDRNYSDGAYYSVQQESPEDVVPVASHRLFNQAIHRLRRRYRNWLVFQDTVTLDLENCFTSLALGYIWWKVDGDISNLTPWFDVIREYHENRQKYRDALLEHWHQKQWTTVTMDKVKETLQGLWFHGHLHETYAPYPVCLVELANSIETALEWMLQQPEVCHFPKWRSTHSNYWAGLSEREQQNKRLFCFFSWYERMHVQTLAQVLRTKYGDECLGGLVHDAIEFNGDVSPAQLERDLDQLHQECLKWNEQHVIQNDDDPSFVFLDTIHFSIRDKQVDIDQVEAQLEEFYRYYEDPVAVKEYHEIPVIQSVPLDDSTLVEALVDEERELFEAWMEKYQVIRLQGGTQAQYLITDPGTKVRRRFNTAHLVELMTPYYGKSTIKRYVERAEIPTYHDAYPIPPGGTEAPGIYNTWDGWRIVKLFEKHPITDEERNAAWWPDMEACKQGWWEMLSFITDHNHQAIQFVKLWLRKLIQWPAIKTNVMLLFVSVFVGAVGKTRFWDWIGTYVLGEEHYFMTTKPSDEVIGQPFNDMVENKILVLMDENGVDPHDRKSGINVMKNLIDAKTLNLRQMHTPVRKIPNYLNMVATSNTKISILGSADPDAGLKRRCFANECSSTIPLPNSIRQKVDPVNDAYKTGDALEIRKADIVAYLFYMDLMKYRVHSHGQLISPQSEILKEIEAQAVSPSTRLFVEWFLRDGLETRTKPNNVITSGVGVIHQAPHPTHPLIYPDRVKFMMTDVYDGYQKLAEKQGFTKERIVNQFTFSQDLKEKFHVKPNQPLSDFGVRYFKSRNTTDGTLNKWCFEFHVPTFVNKLAGIHLMDPSEIDTMEFYQVKDI